MFFPTLTTDMLTPLKAIAGQMKTNPDYLKDSPYPEEVRNFLKSFLGGELKVEPLEIEDMDVEIAKLIRDVRTVADSSTGIDAKDRASVLKTQGQLLERAVALKERVTNLRNLSDFQKRVMTALETVLNADQRTKFIKILGEYAQQ